MDAANLLKPMLARGELRCIGATTLKEYRQHVEKDPAFERRFQPVLVNEPSVAATISILRGLKDRYQTHHGIRIMDSAIVLAAKLADRYIQNRFLPDKAIDLVDGKCGGGGLVVCSACSAFFKKKLFSLTLPFLFPYPSSSLNVTEACANVRVQLDSRPEKIDQLERQLLQLEIEATALKQEKDDAASKARLEQVQKEMSVIEEELKPLRMQYDEERERISEQQMLQNKVSGSM